MSADERYHVTVRVSGGAASYVAAKLTLEEFGHEGVSFVFSDTKIEDEDLYRFLDDMENALQHPIIRIAYGRTPWQVFFQGKMMGNHLVDPCSHHLKRKVLDLWSKENCTPDCTLVIGYDANENHRLQRLAPRLLPVRVRAPLIERNIWKEDALKIVEDDGIRLPRLYTMGFPHNNCGGFCIKAGQASFALLLKHMPERYAGHESAEQAFRELTGKDVSIMRDRRGGESRPLTMKALRERIEADENAVDKFDLGGCACMEEPA